MFYIHQLSKLGMSIDILCIVMVQIFCINLLLHLLGLYIHYHKSCSTLECNVVLCLPDITFCYIQCIPNVMHVDMRMLSSKCIIEQAK